MGALQEIIDSPAGFLVEPRFERIRGTVYAMASPSAKHQIILGNLHVQLHSAVAKYNCITLIAPFDVFLLYDADDENTLVQPDIFLACDKTKLRENGYFGAPPFIIEILSNNRSHDMVTKLNLYQEAGVSEYWIVDPVEDIVMTFVLHDSGYVFHSYDAGSEVPVSFIPGLSVDFRNVFPPAPQP